VCDGENEWFDKKDEEGCKNIKWLEKKLKC
jgi:hypothetical protein